MSATSLLAFLLPYRFSLLAVTVFPLAALGYAAGRRRLAGVPGCPGGWRTLAFYAGLLLSYVVLHTRFDYYGQFVFFMHRGQHLVLHHLGALLIALGNPIPVFKTLVPRKFSRSAWYYRAPAALMRVVQNPAVAALLFVGLIIFWLIPSIHFAAMLSQPLYLLMNWSMLVDGVLFWLLLVDPRPPAVSRMPRYWVRLLMIWFTMVPQIVVGAMLTFSHHEWYDIYAICGRAIPIPGDRDQVLGGLLTWIPPAMMEVAVALIVLSMMLGRERDAAPDAVLARRAVVN